MANSSGIASAGRPSRLSVCLVVAIWLLLAVGLPLSASTLNFFRLARAPFGFWIAAHGAIMGLALLALFHARRIGDAGESWMAGRSLTLAAQTVGVAVLLGFTGVVATLGFDGLALPLGAVAGVALSALLIAPAMRGAAGRSLAEVFALRYGSAALGTVVTGVALIATVLLLAATFKSAAVAIQALLPVDHAIAAGVMALATAVAFNVRHHIASPPRAIAGYVVITLGVLCTVALAAAGTGPLHLDGVTLGAPLQQHADLNQALVLDKLANVAALTPLASPFLQMTMRNFAGLVLALGLGIAVAPFLMRMLLAGNGEAGGGRARCAAGATAAVALVALLVAPLAIYSRIGFEQQLLRGIDSKDVPQPVADASALHWVRVCGVYSALPIDIAAGCAKVSGQKGKLRLQDLEFSPDGQVLGANRVAFFSPARDLPLVIAAILAGLMAGCALLTGCLPSVERQNERRALPAATAILVIAAYIAAVASTASAFLAAEGFAFLAAALFPALVLGLYWRGMNAAGATVAIVTGALLAGLYMAGVHLCPETLLKFTGSLSDAGPAVGKRLADLNATAAAATDATKIAAIEAEIARIAERSANWWGLKPAAIVLVAVPISFVAGIVASLAFRPRAAASAP